MICVYNEKTRGLNIVIYEVEEHYITHINGSFVFSGDTLKECFEELEKMIERRFEK